ncbi:hypothetical protein J2I47_13090 [Fibrella sp. HMF5335]|uniref:Uncharacterized protein n=1 Tax=Fibrella rubiginis TaxID=2817060 RepID=A0A939GIP4_9BACT|nr:hypothetical protein [Fibrella rubiginis]MBO0937485.1 hypothetical protein [Fibrella rubiginis]
MYFPPVTTPSIVHDDQVVWAPAIHQRVIAQLTTGLGILYYKEHSISLEPLPETMLDEGKASPVPDLSLCNNTTDETPIIIEVCHSKGQKEDLQKVIQLIDAELYGIMEGFVYNYKTNEWLRYCKGDGGVATTSSFSALLDLDLAQFLNL